MNNVVPATELRGEKAEAGDPDRCSQSADGRYRQASVPTHPYALRPTGFLTGQIEAAILCRPPPQKKGSLGSLMAIVLGEEGGVRGP